MTGFKSGSAGDPFGSDEDEDDVDEPDEAEASAPINTNPQPETHTDHGAGHGDRDETESASPSSSGLPWIYERDSITDGRTTVQLHLQDESVNRERQGKSDVETILSESVKKADLREAALLVGLDHVDEVADQLREWGYDFE